MKGYSCIFSLICSAFLMVFISCSSDVTPSPQAETPFVSRLIFIGDANVGGSAKVEIKDSYIESILDGNPDWQGNILTPTTALPLYSAPVKVTISNLSYYDQVVDEIVCSDDVKNKILLQYRGPFGAYFMGTDSKLYRETGVLQYIEQGLSEYITSASIETFFFTSCQDTNNVPYEVSFYPYSDELSHGITTIFNVTNGSLRGIIRIHRVGDGHVPYIDLLF